MRCLNLFKMLKYWCLLIAYMRDLISLIAWFQVNKSEITVLPSQSPSVVPLLNSLKKHISSNKILFCFDEMFKFLMKNLMNRQLLKWWHFVSYWISEILCFLQPLWTMVSGKNHYIEIIIWINYLSDHGVSFGFYASYHKSSFEY